MGKKLLVWILAIVMVVGMTTALAVQSFADSFALYGDGYEGWEDISEDKREGRRLMARWLMDNGIGLTGRASPKTVPPRVDVSTRK